MSHTIDTPQVTRSTPYSALPEWLTADDVAAYLGISRNATYEYLRRGDIPSRRIGRVIRVPRAALQPEAR